MREDAVIRRLHVTFNGLWRCRDKKNNNHIPCECMWDIGEHAAGPHSNIFLWDLHCNPLEFFETPSSPHCLCSHTVECTGLWILLSSQEDNGCVDAGMHACTDTKYISPFHPVSFGHSSWGYGLGKRRDAKPWKSWDCKWLLVASDHHISAMKKEEHREDYTARAA